MTLIRRHSIAAIGFMGLALAACSGASTPGPSAPAASSIGGAVTTEADAVARVVAVEPRFAGIGPRDPDLIGQSSWFGGAGLRSGCVPRDVRIGWGCPAGCIDEHRWL